MSKKIFVNRRKACGRSSGILTKDPILGDMVSEKVLKARKSNNPSRYKNV